MAYVPGKPKMIHAGGIGGGQSIIDFAKEQYVKLSSEQQNAAIEAGKALNGKMEADPDLVYRLTHPDTGEVIDLRTGKPWGESSPAPDTPVVKQSDAKKTKKGKDKSDGKKKKKSAPKKGKKKDGQWAEREKTGSEDADL